MSSTAGTAGQIISLPKGGGAIQGLGEKFQPDLFTGTGNFTVPIQIPPGRNGFQPQLTLAYSTGNGNSPFGLGWKLSIPEVSRKTSKGVPCYIDSEDVFILSGAEDLVLVKSPEEINTRKHYCTRYRPRTEGLYARIEHHRIINNQGGMESDYWEVRSKDGLVSFYGTPGSAGNDSAVITDPGDPTKIFSWKLTETRDPFGNRIEYKYERDSAEEGPHYWDQLYLKQIQYVDYTEQGTTEFLVSIIFEYEEERPDTFSEYRPGFEIRTRKRCTRIEIHTKKEHPVRAYDLTYLDQQSEGEALHFLNNVSLLSQIKVVGYDDFQEELPPLDFSYTHFEPERRNFFPLEGTGLPAASLANPNLELVDVFGNGLPDILEINGVVRYWRNLGQGRFDLPRQMQTAPAGVCLEDRGVQLIDANGDGQTDLLVTTENCAGYYPLRFGGLWDRKSFQQYRTAPSFDLEDPEVRLVDLDGDGVTDAIRSGSRLECFFNHPKEGWNKTRWVERQALEEFPNVIFSDPRIKWGDMTGDGLKDILCVYDGNIEYWPNLGHGNWGKRISMRNSPRFPNSYDPKRILVGDVDGDGLADIVYVDDTKVTLWINQSGTCWSEPVIIQGTPPVTDMDTVRLVDMLGTGIAGILWSSEPGGMSREHLFFLDFTGGVKPYLLNEINNCMGAVTRIEYAPSTRYYLEDERSPETRWTTPLPFPVHVVARIEVIDQLSGGKLTTEYSYHHGYWDGAEREFRGFGRVDQRDTEVFERYCASGLHRDRTFQSVEYDAFSPPVETRTWFHQGPIGDEFGDWEESDFTNEFWTEDSSVLKQSEIGEFLSNLPRRARRDALRTLRGRILRTEVYAVDGTQQEDRPYTVTEYLHGVREGTLPGEENRLRIFFPHLLAQRVTQWERGNEPMTQITFTEDYDDYGQALTQITIAVPRGKDFPKESSSGEPYLVTLVETEYAQRDDTECYMVDRVASTTTYEILNDGSSDIFALHEAISDENVEKRVIGQTLNFYDGDAFEGLEFREVGDYGAVVRTETLAFTEEILENAYRNDQGEPEKPPYLTDADWTEEYPQEFRDLLPANAGYIYCTGTSYVGGYYTVTNRRKYDFHEGSGNGRGLILTSLDPLGGETLITYDDFDLLPVEVTDPAALSTKVQYNYGVFQVEEVADPNGNRTFYAFTPSGFLKSIAIMGKKDEQVGDTPDVPGTRFHYDLMAFLQRGQPVSVRTVRRVHHVNTDVPLPERDETIESMEYSDGFGRLLQTRMQAEDIVFGNTHFGDSGLPADQSCNGDAVGKYAGENPYVVVSGWKTYDNKGRVVERYEPFFSTGWEYAPPGDEEYGQKATMYYDPRGNIILTVNPDGSEQRIIHGIPLMDNPDDFTPTPWEIYTYDTNDNAGRTHHNESLGYQHHWNTPSHAEQDALGRTIRKTERNGQDSDQWYTTNYTHDIQGNLLTVADALQREAFRHVYDLKNQKLRTEQLDAGVIRIVLDAAGSTVEQRDSKGALILRAYDDLNRPIRLWAQDKEGDLSTLREKLVYGDSSDSGLTSREAAARNLLGNLLYHYDEAGLLTLEKYDFKGNVFEKVRQVIKNECILCCFEGPETKNWEIQPFKINWKPPKDVLLGDYANSILDSFFYRTSFTYDALNRVKTMHLPEDVTGNRKTVSPHYNRAGALERIELDGEFYVRHIAYNAKGQRILIAYGNGTMTRYTYNSKTFRPVRLRTESYTNPDPLTYHPKGIPLQDFAYEYDLAGNILAIHDRTPDCGILPQRNTLDRFFSYDPLYRLLKATGRECDALPSEPPWNNNLRCEDTTRTRPYTETYEYDPVENMTCLRHNGGSNGYTRTFTTVSGGNRLAEMTTGETMCSYAYDACGNLTGETALRHFGWDHSNRMQIYRTQVAGSEPSVYAHYLYDSQGNRVGKLVRKQGGRLERIVYIDGIFEHYCVIQGKKEENNTLHVMDDKKRIATVRVGPSLNGDATPPVKYYLGDHLGSSNVVTNERGNQVNREEYTPYGETSFGSFAKKRYRFSGKEKDEESALYYFGTRYYAPWVARWESCDPAGMVDSLNSYSYVTCNPVRLVDPSGDQKEEAESAVTQTVFRSQEVICGASSGSEQPETAELDSISNKREVNVASNIADKVSLISEIHEKVGPIVEKVLEDVEMKTTELAQKGLKWGMSKYQKLQMSRRGEISLKPKLWNASLQKYAGKAQRMMTKVRLGSSVVIGKSLKLGTTATAAYAQYKESTAQTKVGKVLEVVAGQTLSNLVGRTPLRYLDMVTRGQVSEHVQVSVRAIVSLAEAAITKETGGIRLFHEQSKRGEYGVVFQATSEAGEYWDKHGIIGGLKEFGRAVKDAWRMTTSQSMVSGQGSFSGLPASSYQCVCY